jgi:hypothetical protein
MNGPISKVAQFSLVILTNGRLDNFFPPRDVLHFQRREWDGNGRIWSLCYCFVGGLMDDDGTTCAIEDWIYPLFIVANSHIARRQTGIAAPEINSFPIIA